MTTTKFVKKAALPAPGRKLPFKKAQARTVRKYKGTFAKLAQG